MNRECWSVRLPNGKTRIVKQLAGESHAEFSGRAWVQIETWIRGTRGGPPIAAGTLVTRTIEYPHDVSTFRSTGNPYVNRWERVMNAEGAA